LETAWFICVGFMLTMYVLLDGFDLGAGAGYLIMGLLYILLMVREVAHGPEAESEEPELTEGQSGGQPA